MIELTVLNYIQKLLSFALILQTIELMQVKTLCGKSGVWVDSILHRDYGHFKHLFNPNLFNIMIWARLILSIELFFQISLFVILSLFILTVLINLRWRGSFNGGSDSMTLIVLLGLIPHELFNSPIALKGGLYFIAIHSVFSYFLAGFTKVKKSKWQNGQALQIFLKDSLYFPSAITARVLSRQNLLVAFSWATIIFECAFPFALFNSQWCALFLLMGGLFHLANVYFLGLNRFFWIWITTYPAVYYLSMIHFF